jgi:hypothetical protein
MPFAFYNSELIVSKTVRFIYSSTNVLGYIGTNSKRLRNAISKKLVIHKFMVPIIYRFDGTIKGIRW